MHFLRKEEWASEVLCFIHNNHLAELLIKFMTWESSKTARNFQMNPTLIVFNCVCTKV